MKRSEAINELVTALAIAQGKIGGALRDAKNPFYDSTYADLASVWSACREALSSNGLSVVQSAQCIDTDAAIPIRVVVTTLLAHTSGQWLESELSMWPRDNSPHAIGSAISYARRYSLASMVGIYQEDDDANKAQPLSAAQVPEFSQPLVPSGLDAVVAAIVKEDAKALRGAWNDAMGLGNADNIWKLLNTKQKKTARELLNLTAPKEEDDAKGQHATAPRQ
jgi:hypothetical protein